MGPGGRSPEPEHTTSSGDPRLLGAPPTKCLSPATRLCCGRNGQALGQGGPGREEGCRAAARGDSPQHARGDHVHLL